MFRGFNSWRNLETPNVSLMFRSTLGWQKSFLSSWWARCAQDQTGKPIVVPRFSLGLSRASQQRWSTTWLAWSLQMSPAQYLYTPFADGWQSSSQAVDCFSSISLPTEVRFLVFAHHLAMLDDLEGLIHGEACEDWKWGVLKCFGFFKMFQDVYVSWKYIFESPCYSNSIL